MKSEELLEKAKGLLYEQALMDAEDDNILYVLDRQFDEAHTHSKILMYLMTRPAKKDKTNSFLVAFLRQLNVPEKYRNKTWYVYRERVFDEGRIDFVLETTDYVVAIEMKLGAADGNHQLDRYNSFCKSRRKEYALYYLTIDGRKPSQQSIGDLDLNRLHCISFERDILEWLSECMSYTEKDGYKHSFIKQYMGTIKQITGKGTVFGMSGLINDSETAYAVVELHAEFEQKMADVLLQFLSNLNKYVANLGNCECIPYGTDIDAYYFSKKKTYPGFYIILDKKQIGSFQYNFFLSVEISQYLYLYFGFEKVKKTKEAENISMDQMLKKDSEFYYKCINKIKPLKIRDFKKENSIWWAYIENTKGGKLDFKNCNSSVIDLIDEMDIQVEYIGEYIVNLLKQLV